MDCLQLQFIRGEEAVSWTQRLLTRKFGPKIKVYLWQTNLKANVCKNSTFQVNRKENGTGRWRLTSSNRAAILSTLYAKNDTTNPFGYKLGESTENNKALFFFPGKETIPTFNGSRGLSHYAVVCEVMNLWIAMFKNSAKNRFLNFHVIWSVSQIVLFNGFLSDFVAITSCVYTKTIILFNLGEKWL